MSVQKMFDLMEYVDLQEAEIVLCDFYIGVFQSGETVTPRDKEFIARYLELRAKHEANLSKGHAALILMANP
jgi:hypothetical protein